MSVIKEIIIRDFAGIADDPRIRDASKFVIAKHFDVFTNPNRMLPYRSLSADTNDGSSSTGMKQYQVKDFVYSSTDAKLYGLGQTGGGLAEIFYKADATTGNWTVPASSSGNGAVKNGCFFEYKDYLWGFQGTNQIFKWGLLSGSPSITNSASTVASTITSVANGVISADGNAYMSYNNVVVRISPAGTVTDSAIYVPVNFKITSLCNYGKYLAIAAAPISTFEGKSKVFIWNLSSDLFQETVDWGEGELRILETIEGYLVGVTDRYLNNSVGAGRGSMIIQTYSGGVPQVVKEIFTEKITGQAIPLSKAVKNNRLFWSAKIFTNTAGTEYNEGIWSFGRKNVNNFFNLNLDIIDENVSTAGIQAFGTAGNFFFITHSTDGSIDKTSSTATYSFTSIYESQILDLGDVNITKKLQGISVMSAPITTGGTITVKYKKDGDTSWTTIGSYTVSSSIINRDFINIESTGADFGSAREYKFRVESTAGAEVTAIKAKFLLLNEIN